MAEGGSTSEPLLADLESQDVWGHPPRIEASGGHLNALGRSILPCGSRAARVQVWLEGTAAGRRRPPAPAAPPSRRRSSAAS
jgi:hypothetical protein